MSVQAVSRASCGAQRRIRPVHRGNSRHYCKGERQHLLCGAGRTPDRGRRSRRSRRRNATTQLSVRPTEVGVQENGKNAEEHGPGLLDMQRGLPERCKVPVIRCSG
jgi:hypothetical protein